MGPRKKNPLWFLKYIISISISSTITSSKSCNTSQLITTSVCEDSIVKSGELEEIVIILIRLIHPKVNITDSLS